MKRMLLIASVIILHTVIMAQAPAVNIPLIITDNSGTSSGKVTLNFGIDPSATDGMDAALDEQPLPPLPPTGILDARFLLPNNESSLKDYKQGSSAFVGDKIYTLQYQPGSGTSIIVKWKLPKGVKGRIQDKITGNLINVAISDSGSYTVDDPESFPKLKLTISYMLAPLLAPKLLSPVNNSKDQQFTVLLNWNLAQYAESYKLQVAKDEGFNSLVINDSTVTETSKQIGPLDPYTKYYWRVSTRNTNAVNPYSPYSEIWNFQTKIPSPQVPVQVSPQNNSTGQPLVLTFSWNAVQFAENYHLQVASDADFTTLIENDSLLKSTSKQIDLLDGSTKYYWRIRAKNSTGTSAYSTVWSFTRVDVAWLESINLSNGNNSGLQKLTYGISSAASDGQDASIGEQVLPPLPPAEVFDVRFTCPGTPSFNSLIDFRAPSNSIITWKINIQAGDGGYPVTLNWNSASMPGGTMFLKDNINGSIINVNMKTQSSFTLTDPDINILKIEYRKFVCIDLPVVAGWNIVSVPVTVPDMSSLSLFTDANSPTYMFSGGYQSVTTLENGKGYWIRYPLSKSINLCGTAITTGTIPVNAGWNLLGIYDKDLPVSSLTFSPGVTLTSPFYGFSAGYQTVQTLSVGKGYWVRSSQAGFINLPSGSSKMNSVSFQPEIKKDWGKIIIIDQEGNRGVLYAAKTVGDLLNYDLPPAPPEGIFDVRFGSERYVEDLRSGSAEIKFSSAAFPVRLKVEGMELKVMEMVNGNLVSKVLKNGEEFILQNKESNKIAVEMIEIPLNYEIFQNYPNPFNPSTNISYMLGKDSNVKLRVYNALGEMVAELVNEIQSAGMNEVIFNAANLSSGIYFYEVQAKATDGSENFREIKKLMLLK